MGNKHLCYLTAASCIPLTSIWQCDSSNLWKQISLKRKNGYLELFAFVFYYNCRYFTLWISSIILMTIIFVIQSELIIKMRLLSIRVQIKKKDLFIKLIVLNMLQQQVNLIIQICLIIHMY